MQDNTAITGINWGNVIISIFITLIAGYISLLVRSIRKETAIKFEWNESLYSRQIENCTERYKEIKKQIEELMTRASILFALDERLKSGAEKFSLLEKQMGELTKRVDLIKYRMNGD